MSKKKERVPNYPADWTVVTETRVNGRILTPGTEVSIRGERGRFRFVKRVTNPRADWLDFVGGKKGHAAFRSFGEDRVRRVHRISHTRENQAKESAA